MRVVIIHLMLYIAFFTQSTELCFAGKFPTEEKFLKARAPLAPDQDTLIKRAFYKYLLSRPEALYKCVKNLVTQSRFVDLAKTPELFDIFKLLRTRTQNPTAQMSLPFTNEPGTFGDICPTVYGVCQGMTNLDRRLAMLIYYDPKNVSSQTVPGSDRPEERFAYFEALIAKVMRGYPVVLPGYLDLKTFASEQMGNRILREAAMKLWATENATLPSATQVLQGIKHTVSKKEVRDLHIHLTERVKLHYPPIIYLARAPKEAGKKWIHVMQVLSVTDRKEDGSYQIQVKDPNYYSIPARIRKITVDGSGSTRYDGFPLTEVDIVPGDDHEIAEFLLNTIQFCRENPVFCTTSELAQTTAKLKSKTVVKKKPPSKNR